MCPPDRLPCLEELLPSWDKSMVSELGCPAALAHAFHALDRDGDGEVSSMDLLSFFCEPMHQRLSQEEAQAMVAAADLDGNGSVNLSEFRQLLGSMQFGKAPCEEGFRTQPHAMAVLWDAFCVLDVDKDGRISPVDLRIALPSSAFSAACIEDMLAAAHEERLIEFQGFTQLIMNA